MLNVIASILCLFTTAMLAILGVDWITIGYGLNPWIAFPLAIAFAVVSISQAYIGCLILDGESMQRKVKRSIRIYGNN